MVGISQSQLERLERIAAEHKDLLARIEQEKQKAHVDCALHGELPVMFITRDGLRQRVAWQSQNGRPPREIVRAFPAGSSISRYDDPVTNEFVPPGQRRYLFFGYSTDGSCYVYCESD